MGRETEVPPIDPTLVRQRQKELKPIMDEAMAKLKRSAAEGDMRFSGTPKLRLGR